MTYDPKISIEGIQEAMAKNNRRIAALKPNGASEEAVREAIITLHRYAVQITHVGKYTGGGALKSSHRMDVQGLEGKVYIDPSSVSPRRGSAKQMPVIYGVFEHARGGEHAFYDRTIAEIGGAVVNRAQRRIAEAVLYGK